MPTVITKKSTVAAKVPLSTDLQVGELAVNTADKKLYSKHSDNSVVEIGKTLPGGSTTQVQYNNAGAFAGDSGLTYNNTSKTLTIGGATTTTSAPVVNAAQTWNASGTTFIGKLTNITNTASAAASLIEDWRINGYSALSLRKDGQLVMGGQVAAAINAYGNALQLGGDAGPASSKMDIGGNGENRVGIASNVVVAWATSTAAGYYTSVDTGLAKNATGVVEVNSGIKGTLRDLTLRNLIGTGSISTALSAKTSDYTLTANDGTITADSTSAPFTLTLPTAVGHKRIHAFVKTAGANAVTIDGNASETIDGSLSVTLTDRTVIQSNGTNWVRIA